MTLVKVTQISKFTALQVTFDFWPVYSGEQFRASGPSCYLFILSCRLTVVFTDMQPSRNIGYSALTLHPRC